MKEKFRHWNKYSPDEIEKIWNNSFISFDTNVLLGLYRISPQLSSLFFELTAKIKERIFIPYHVAYEFHKNKFNVITENFSILSKLRKDIEKFESDIIKSSFYNYLSQNTKIAIKSDIDSKNKKIKEREEYYKKLEKEDTIYLKLDELFEDNIEDGLDDKILSEIPKIGKERYSKKMPPGYEDKSKENGNEYGDLVIWKEIINKAISENSNILFVTNEQKSDWLWVLKDKQIIGPRPELKEEFYNETKNHFQIVNLENYIFSLAELTATKINTNITKKEFKFESVFETNFLKVLPPLIKQTFENTDILKQQEEAKNIQKMIEEIVSKPQIDLSEKKLLEDLRFRKKVIDENILKAYSASNNK